MHVTKSLLAAAERGELPLEDLVEILKAHLAVACNDCRAAISDHQTEAQAGLGGLTETLGGPLERLAERRRLDVRSEARKAAAWVREIVRLGPGKRGGRIRGAYTRFRGAVFGTLLLEEARRAIPAEPAASLSLAEAALLSSSLTEGRLDPEIHAAALAVAGNAKRALGRLKEAEHDLARAKKLLDEPEMRDPVLPAEVEFYLGSLRRNQGRLDEAAEYLGRARHLYRWLGQREDAARVLLQLGNVHYRAHRIDAAVEAVDGVLELLGAEAEGWLHVAAYFNRAWFLHATGDLQDAEAELEAHAELLEKEGPWGRQHLAWLRARITWSRGDLEAAEHLYTETRELTIERGIAFDTSLVDLELCLVYLAQGRTARVKTLATEALEVFAEQEVEQEVRAALALVVEAARREALTRELIERAIATLERSGRR
jgi:tetratricopeptide (TPR) repeat protein